MLHEFRGGWLPRLCAMCEECQQSRSWSSYLRNLLKLRYRSLEPPLPSLCRISAYTLTACRTGTWSSEAPLTVTGARAHTDIHGQRRTQGRARVSTRRFEACTYQKCRRFSSRRENLGESVEVRREAKSSEYRYERLSGAPAGSQRNKWTPWRQGQRSRAQIGRRRWGLTPTCFNYSAYGDTKRLSTETFLLIMTYYRLIMRQRSLLPEAKPARLSKP